jgi:WD40 repeat protein
VWAGAIPGAVIGGAQWLVLRVYLRNAGWWVVVNALAWGLSLGILGTFLGTMSIATALVGLSDTVAGAMLITGLALIAGAISGLGLLSIAGAERPSATAGRLRRVALPASLLLMFMVMLALCLFPFVYAFGAYTPVGLLGGEPGLVRQFNSGAFYAEDVEWSPDGKLIATASDRAVQIWDAGGGRVARFGDFRGGAQMVRWSPAGNYLATISNEPSDTLRVWGRSDWKAVITTDPGPKSEDRYAHATGVSWSPDGKRMAVGVSTSTTKGIDYLRQIGANGMIKIYDVPGGQVSATLVYSEASSVWSVAWSPDGLNPTILQPTAK